MPPYTSLPSRMLSPGLMVERSSTSMAAKPEEKLSAYLPPSTDVYKRQPVYLLTKGGPGTATTVPSYYSYNQFFQVQQVGYGAAISTALTVVIIVFSVVFTIIQKRVEKNMEMCIRDSRP